MWKRVTSANITPPYKSTIPSAIGRESRPTFPPAPAMANEMSPQPTYAIPETQRESVSKTGGWSTSSPKSLSVTSTPRMMSDNLQWITKPTLSQDGSLTGAAEKFQIQVNTEGFRDRDIEVFTRNGKLHVKAFRQEINKSTGAQITNRLERSYDVPYDVDAGAMSVRFPNENTMLVEFPVSKPAFCNANRNSEGATTTLRPHMTTNTSYYEQRYPPVQQEGLVGRPTEGNKTRNTTSSYKTSESVTRMFPPQPGVGTKENVIVRDISSQFDVNGSSEVLASPVRMGDGGRTTHKATLVNVKCREFRDQPSHHSSADKIYVASNKACLTEPPVNCPLIEQESARHYDVPVPAALSQKRGEVDGTAFAVGDDRRPKVRSSLPPNTMSSLYPRIVVDDQTGKRKVSFSIEVHGFEPHDFHVSVNNNRLLIEANHVSGSRGVESEDIPMDNGSSQKRYFRKEVTLPPETDINRLRTLLIDGCILEIEAPVIESQWVSVPIERKS